MTKPEQSNEYEPDVMKADCPSRRTLDLLADTWTILVLSAIKLHIQRYSQLQNRIEGISSKMLSKTLRKLERDGLIERITEPTTGYRLTALGRSLIPTLEAMYEWAESNYQEVEIARKSFSTNDTK